MGNWNDLLIGEWGVLDMLVDPYTFSNTGAIRVRAFMTVDVGVRYARCLRDHQGHRHDLIGRVM
jgi:hypothetical protein